jgi:hypothetical protein
MTNRKNGQLTFQLRYLWDETEKSASSFNPSTHDAFKKHFKPLYGSPAKRGLEDIIQAYTAALGIDVTVALAVAEIDEPIMFQETETV